MDYYSKWVNEGGDGCEGPWFDGMDALVISHDGDNTSIMIEHKNQEELGFDNPAEGLEHGGDYVISITENPEGDWINYEDETYYDLTFRPMTSEEAEVFNASLTLPEGCEL